MTPMEAQLIRSQLKLRWNTEYGCYQVFSTIHGSGVFRWFKISEDIAKWYHEHFNISMPDNLKISLKTGAFHYFEEIEEHKE